MTLKDEEKTIKGILKGIMKSDKYWLENIANFTYNQKGGSAKGWAFEESSFRQLEDTAVDITRAGSMEPNTDYHVNVCNDVIPIQAKAYTMKTPSSKAQLSTMAQTNYFEDGLPKFFNKENGEFDGKGYSKYLNSFKVPMDILLSTNPKTMTSTLYAFHFTELFKKCVTYKVLTKKRITVQAIEPKSGKLLDAFMFGPDSSAKNNCLSRGIWVKNWFLKTYVKPLSSITVNNEDLFGLYLKAKSLQRKKGINAF